MKHIWECRRTGMAFISIMGLIAAMLLGKYDTSGAIAAVAIGLAGANAYQKKGRAE